MDEPARYAELRGDRVGAEAALSELRNVQRTSQVRGEEGRRPDGRLTLREQVAQDTDGAGVVARGEAIGQLLHLVRPAGRRDGPHVQRLDARPGPGVQTHLLDFAREDTEVAAAPVDELLDGGRPDLVPALAGEADDPALRAAHVDPLEGEGGRGTHAGGEEAAALIGRSGDEDQTPTCTERRQACEDRFLLRLAQCLGVTDDEALRSAEKRGRGQVVERGGQAIRVLVCPQGPPPHVASIGREPRSQEPEGALDEVGLFAVEEVAGTKRRARQGGEGVRSLPGRRPPGRAQKPSIACS